MQITLRSFIQCISLVFFVMVSPSLVMSQDQGVKPDYSWLNGKWRGAPPQGGEMEMDLEVVNGNQVKGSGHILQFGNRRTTSRDIEGTVNGNKVELSFFGNETAKYDLTYVDGTLKGTGTNPSTGPVETAFTKSK